MTGPAGSGAGPTPTPEQRLAELGLTLPEVVTPVAAYVPAVLTGKYVYTAGQLPMVAGQLAGTGKVGAGIGTEEAAALARICALNALAAAVSVTGSLSAIRRIVKVTGFVASAPDFTDQALVVNGASEVLIEIFGDAGRHARSAVGMAVLPRARPGAIELFAEVPPQAAGL